VRKCDLKVAPRAHGCWRGAGADLGKGNSCCFMRLEKFQRGVSLPVAGLARVYWDTQVQPARCEAKN
jgi:hypothetical protein